MIATEKMTENMMTGNMVVEMEACQQICIECQNVCMEALNYCKHKTNIDMSMMYMMRDCAEMAMMCVNTITDGSEFAGRTCELCAQMCTKTALAADLIADEMMTKVAIACRKCAKSCDRIATQSTSYFPRPNSLMVADIV